MATSPKTTQPDKFKDAARELEADDDEKRFDERLKRIGASRPAPRPKAGTRPKPE